MDEFTKKIAELETKIDAVYASVETMRKYFLASLILSIAFVVLPLIALVFLIPKVFSMYSNLGI